MNARKLQATTSSKHQGNTNFQAPRNCAGSRKRLNFGVWSFSGAWCLLSLSASAVQPSISLSGMPLFFEPQEAMVGDSSAYFARGQNYQFAITATGAQIALSQVESEQNEPSGHASRIIYHESCFV